jgi:hypothetical protein
MPLKDLNLPIDFDPPPRHVRAFLHEAGRRISRFQDKHSIPAFVTSDFEAAYPVLRALAAQTSTLDGQLFCEWGSGFGVVTCLAAMLGFDACGIEIEGELVDAAQELADDFELPVEFLCGSFIPAGSKAALSADGTSFAWLTTEWAKARDEAELGPADFAVIYAYPWPDEERLIASLFERHAGAGAVLATYHGGEEFRVRRRR